MIPYFGIQPKTNLFIYLFFSTTFISAWRIYIFPLLKRGRVTPALIFGDGDECSLILNEINNNSRYAIRFVAPCQKISGVGNDSFIIESIMTHKVPVVVMPFSSKHLAERGSSWDALAVSGIRFIDSARLYEELFDRVALPLVTHRWFFEESVRAEIALYALFKRAMDIIISLTALVVLSPFILLIALMLIIQDGGKPFIFQKRVGRFGKDIAIMKFRTMLFDDGGNPEQQKSNRITALGAMLRRTRFDEVPQFFNVLWGDLSLIGPRPEIRSLAEEYERAIPFYNARHLMQPGLSGWAQIKHASPPKFSLDMGATAEKLSYDLYYLKHRSFMLDISIALRTVKILLSWVGR
jgi:lipopolysaccharide/colanic/teichoic acid biosynthesis glycosyltransferase